ncbi:MAG: PKD domain-containing protein [Saprospiraceae bacterium]
MRKIIGFIFWLFISLHSEHIFAKHIIGGDMFYKCLRVDTARKVVNFAVTLKMYRDCYAEGGAELDPSIVIGFYEKLPNGSFRYLKKLSDVRLKSIILLDPEPDNPCLIIPEDVCVQEGTYEFQTGNLPFSANSYYIVYQRCCRNESISNIINPGEDGAAFVIEISPEAQRLCNNSPRFLNFPPIVICVNNPLNFDHSIFDDDGDLVTYEFCTPLKAGGQDGGNGATTCFGVMPDPLFCPPPYNTVTFRSPTYSTIYPLAGNPLVTINPITGLISGTPTVQGQFVVGVCIKEYRNGILLTETRRDFQFNVTYCEPKVFAKLKADSILNGNNFVINSCGKATIDFFNQSSDIKFIQRYNWSFNIQGVEQMNTNRDAQFTFPGFGSYAGKMILNEGSQCSDSAMILVNVYPGIRADYGFRYDTCVAGPVIFSDSSFTGSGNLVSWNWNFSSFGTSIIPNPSFSFTTPGKKSVRLEVQDINGCKDDTVAIIPYFPVPPILIVDPSAFDGCTPLNVCFRNLSVPIDTSYDIIWDFGDGNFGNQISPCHTYNDGGVFSIKLKITSPIGCTIEKDYPNLITARLSPNADFSFSPGQLSSFQKTATFIDISNNSNGRQWTFNGKDRTFVSNITHTFQDTGLQKIDLIAISNNGCRDTLTKYIDVEPRVTLFMPNAFTPNGDAKNDEFFGIGYFEGMKTYEMSIWDRWGSRLFMTQDPLQGWNGRFDNQGALLPNGVYVYVVRYTTPRNELIELKGFATIVR